jgi:hypothetical protein
MAFVSIYNDENNAYYRVNFDLKNTVLNDGSGLYETYLVVYTDMRNSAGAVQPTFKVKTLDDVPPGETTAIDFSNLCSKYITYFMDQAELSKSSSSSSSSEQYSSSSSSSSSSEGRSESSSSSSSSPGTP